LAAVALAVWPLACSTGFTTFCRTTGCGWNIPASVLGCSITASARLRCLYLAIHAFC
jgi:hypothetical protein